MNAVVFDGHSVFNSPLCFSFSKQIRLGKPLKDGLLAFPSRKEVLQFSVSSTQCDGSRQGRPPQKSYAPGRTKKEDEGEKSQSFDGKLHESAKQEKIIALFRRIESSISKGEAKSTEQTKDNSSEKSPTESIMKVLHKSQKPFKGDATKRSGRNQVLARKRGVPKKDIQIKNDVQHSAANLNITRPPSNFVKRSPIPSPSIQKGKPIEGNKDASGNTDRGHAMTLPKIEEMKLPELKELAKSKGIKGYSKLKKSELLELLRN